MSTLIATDVTIDRQKREVTVVWDHETPCTFKFAFLRCFCPCANCDTTKHGGEPAPRDVDDFKEITMQSVQEVGRYALRFTWSDGHDTGIYSYDYLHQLSFRIRDPK